MSRMTVSQRYSLVLVITFLMVVWLLVYRNDLLVWFRTNTPFLPLERGHSNGYEDYLLKH